MIAPLPELPLVRIESQRLTTTRWFYGLRWAFPYAGGTVAGGCVILFFLLPMMLFLLKLITATSLRRYGIFDEIWWANPVAIATYLPLHLQGPGPPGSVFLRALILRVKFDDWTDRVP